MTLRLHRVTDEHWLRLAASRRNEDRDSAPPRATIGAIEIELHAVQRLRTIEPDEPRAAATG